MKRSKIIIIVSAVVVVGGLGSYSFLSESSNTTAVNLAGVKKQDMVEIVSASGRIQPETKVDITSEINGEIIFLPVAEGQQVQAGDLLVILDTTQIASDVMQAKFSLDEMRARLEGAKITMDQKRDVFERQELMHKGKLTSDSAYDNSRYAYLNSKAAFQAAKAQTRRLEAAYAKQLDYLDKAKISAPMGGIITFLDVELGEIAAAQTAFTQGRTLMTISNLEQFEVEVEVDETEINKVELGQAVEIEVDALPDTTFRGEVVEIGNTAMLLGLGTQDQSTNFKVKVMFVDVGVKLRPGMSATVDITSAERNDVLAIPFSSVVVRSYNMDSLELARETAASGSSAIAEVQAAEGSDSETVVKSDEDDEKPEHKGVYVLRDGVARFTIVETGIAGQKNLEVTSGLSINDTIISGPYRVLRTIRDGDKVELLEKDDKEKDS